MKYLLNIAIRSAWNRKLTLGLVIISITLSVTLLLSIERLRTAAREGFTQSVSGVDLVVGARGSPVQLMLYAVFHLGDATQNVSWDSARKLAAHPSVAWTIPISLGDSHHGFPVVGTTSEFFRHFHYSNHRPLAFESGKPFDTLFETVIGAEVAEELGYSIGEHITLSHGSGKINLIEHADKPFTVTGILKRTGTPVDRAVHVSLAAIEAIHMDWSGGAPIPGLTITAEQTKKFDLTPKSVTAILVGMHSRTRVFSLQRELNNALEEPLMAILPGVALDQLWRLLGGAERALLLISAMVVAVSLAGLVAVILTELSERRRELAVLRANGASAGDIFTLLVLEGTLVTLIGATSGLVLLNVLILAFSPLIESRYGLSPPMAFAKPKEWELLAIVIGTGLLVSLLPGYRAYRLSLADGLVPRL